jgi:hypothetical protein
MRLDRPTTAAILTTLAVTLGHRLRTAARLGLGLLRELGDESAYARHLANRGLSHSPAEWRAFSDQRLRAKYVRPKCC